MLYGIVSQKASIEDLFIGGLLPGFLMLGLVAALGIREGRLTHAGRAPFVPREAFAALWDAKWEVFLPVFVVGTFLAGVATLVESAPIAALYTVIVQRYLHRDLPAWKDVFRVAGDCIALVGGVLLILAVAAGLTDYLVYAQIPTKLVDWTQAHVHSRVVFLLGLNVFLLLVGTVMDIFSAIVVVVPLILPLAELYGIDYVHLRVIFIANLELGFLHSRSVTSRSTVSSTNTMSCSIAARFARGARSPPRDSAPPSGIRRCPSTRRFRGSVTGSSSARERMATCRS